MPVEVGLRQRVPVSRSDSSMTASDGSRLTQSRRDRRYARGPARGEAEGLRIARPSATSSAPWSRRKRRAMMRRMRARRSAWRLRKRRLPVRPLCSFWRCISGRNRENCSPSSLAVAGSGIASHPGPARGVLAMKHLCGGLVQRTLAARYGLPVPRPRHSLPDRSRRAR